VSSFAVVRHSRGESLAALDTNIASRATALLSLVQIPEEQDRTLVLRRELLVLPPLDKFVVTDSKGRVVANTSGWTPPVLTVLHHRSSFFLTVNGMAYRGLIIRNAVIADSEGDERSRPQIVVLVYAAPTLAMDLHLRNVTIGTALASLTMLVVSLLMTLLIVRMGLRPLDSLAAQASLVDLKTVDWQTPKDAIEISELRPLSSALSETINRLRAAFEHERQMFSDAAHELKTAVAIVKSTLQLALQVRRGADDYRTRLTRALDDTNRLNALVSGMLQLATIESHDAVSRGNTDVAPAIGSVVDQLCFLAQAHGVELRLAPVEPHLVAVPEQEFVLLAMNLVENAIQHSTPGQCVDISINSEATESLLEIRDEGSGISQEALPHIFERFFRTDQSRSRETGGFGLGLAIVRAIVLRYQGTVSVKSALGQGTSFKITLPKGHVSAIDDGLQRR